MKNLALTLVTVIAPYCVTVISSVLSSHPSLVNFLPHQLIQKIIKDVFVTNFRFSCGKIPLPLIEGLVGGALCGFVLGSGFGFVMVM